MLRQGTLGSNPVHIWHPSQHYPAPPWILKRWTYYQFKLRNSLVKFRRARPVWPAWRSPVQTPAGAWAAPGRPGPSPPGPGSPPAAWGAPRAPAPAPPHTDISSAPAPRAPTAERRSEEGDRDRNRERQRQRFNNVFINSTFLLWSSKSDKHKHTCNISYQYIKWLMIR